jgi:ABC-2 type transport system ATP-binding protein
MAQGKAIVVSTHILEEVDAVCSRAVVIAEGRIVADGTADGLLAGLPSHNTVAATVAAGVADAARAALSPLAGRSLAEAAGGDGYVVFRVPAEAGASRLARVTEALDRAGVTAHSVLVERGRLEDVFRLLTTRTAAEGRA